MSWLGRVFGGKKPPVEQPIDTDVSCSFCGLHRRDLRKLIAAPKAHICDACVALCVGVLEAEDRKEGGSFHVTALMAAADLLGPRAAYRELRPLLRAAIEVAQGAPSALRQVTARAARVSDFVTMLAAITAIAPEARQAGDRQQHAVALFHAGRHADALAVLDEATPVAGSLDGLFTRLWRAVIELGQGALARPELEAHLAAARGAVVEIARITDEGAARAARVLRLTAMTYAAIALDELATAEDAAQDRLLLEPDNPWAHEGLARVLRARGDGEAAARAFAKARELHHPELVSAVSLAGAGDGPFR
ncbi:MAG TPA: ClpX C4-type zinc finger protein [Kofleriaceae bacterium]|nr:ClpX C4-type zinc finger protein [Kofleriaceae bacterium]